MLSVATYQLGDPAGAAGYAERAIDKAPQAADYHSNLGRYYLSLGRLSESISTLDRALSIAPTHALAHFNLAVALGNARRWKEAHPHLVEYVRLKPEDPGGHHQLGLTLSEMGRAADAIPYFCRTIELKPDAAEAYNNLGNAMQAIGQARESIPFYEEAMRRRPDYADAATNLGAAYQALGEPDSALGWYNEALRLAPGLVHARGNVANLLAAERKHNEAIAIYESILVETPASAETWNNLGNSLQELGRFDEAMAAYRRALDINPSYFLVHNNVGNTLRRQGRYEEAVHEYQRALAAKPDFVEALNNQAVALADLGRAAEAVALYERAQQIKPDYVDPLINLGNLYRDRARPEQAIELFRQATRVAPRNPFGWNNLGCALSDQGEVREALDSFRHALSLLPDNPHAHSNLLLNLHYTGDTPPEAIAGAHRQYGARFSGTAAAPHANVPDPERALRIGYVSADFRRHSVAFFIEPVVERHDRARFEVFCYADVGRPDRLTERFRELTGNAGWRDIRGYNDARFSELVRADRIDILVDLGGHTANSRLASFAARPAPVQISYLGYPNTTGLEAIGYRLTDAVADPEGASPWHSEELVCLGGSFLAFRPPAGSPPVTPLPSLNGGGAPFTFGSFNNMAKVSDRVVAAWAEILRRVPGSRLALKNKALGDVPARHRLQARFAAHGVGPERLWMSGAIDSLAGHLASYSFVDLGLDTFPYNGTTTTCEALWMGVPVVSYAGSSHVERVGASVLTAARLTDFIAPDLRGYIELAVATAAAPQRLAALRAALRDRLTTSPLLDEPGFTNRLETVYRQLWRRWCAERNHSVEPS